MLNPSEGTVRCKPSRKQFDKIYTVYILGIYPKYLKRQAKICAKRWQFISNKQK